MHKNKNTSLAIKIFIIIFAIFITNININTLATNTTMPSINYQGRLLNNSNTPLNGAYTFRFSLWSDSDWIATDTNPDGSINNGSVNYSAWQEVHDVNTGTFGLFNISLGSANPLPNFDANLHKYLQVEVKTTGSADTTYEILDPQGDTSDAVDRKTMHKEAYAENADTIDNADLGTNAGELAVLSTGGVWDIDRIPNGTNADAFILDFDNSTNTISLQFGNEATSPKIEFDKTNDTLSLSLVNNGDIELKNATLTTDTNSGLNFNNSNQFRIRENNNPNANSDCSNLGELITNTTTNKLMYCTTTGNPGVWTNVDSTSGGTDFENVYANDVDKTLDTNNNNFRINTGLADLTVNSNHWDVDSNGNATFDGNINGVDLTNIAYANIENRVKQIILTPEYTNSVIEKDGGNNKGKLIYDYVDLGGANQYNLYKWTTRQTSLQDIDIVIKFDLPLDFVKFDSNPISLTYQTADNNDLNNKVDFYLIDSVGNNISLTGAHNLANNTWTTANIGVNELSTYTAGTTVTMKVKLSSINTNFANVSSLKIRYIGK